MPTFSVGLSLPCSTSDPVALLLSIEALRLLRVAPLFLCYYLFSLLFCFLLLPLPAPLLVSCLLATCFLSDVMILLLLPPPLIFRLHVPFLPLPSNMSDAATRIAGRSRGNISP